MVNWRPSQQISAWLTWLSSPSSLHHQPPWHFPSKQLIDDLSHLKLANLLLLLIPLLLPLIVLSHDGTHLEQTLALLQTSATEAGCSLEDSIHGRAHLWDCGFHDFVFQLVWWCQHYYCVSLVLSCIMHDLNQLHCWQYWYQVRFQPTMSRLWNAWLWNLLLWYSTT